MFRKTSKIGVKDADEVDDNELTCKNGIVMRKNSKKIRFSTTISFIEVNCPSAKTDENYQSTATDNEFVKDKPRDKESIVENAETIIINNNNQEIFTQTSINERKSGYKKGYFLNYKYDKLKFKFVILFFVSLLI